MQIVCGSRAMRLYSPPPAGQSPARSGGLTTAQELYDHFYAGEAHATVDHLAYQDRGIDLSPYKNEIPAYPTRLVTQGPTLTDYPPLGIVPPIDEHALDFLDGSITHACICVVADGRTRWLGRKATQPEEMWSSSKTFPMMRAAALVGDKAPLEKCVVKDPSSGRSITVPQAYDDIVSYRQGDSMSNALARMFKQFDTPSGIEGWLHQLTGNKATVFRGGYGEAPWISRPELVDDGHIVLHASGADHTGGNAVSAYDETRILTLLALHSHLPAASRIPGLTQDGADTLVRGLGTDSARYLDAAFDALGLTGRIQNPVIISKLGFGFTTIRHQFEQVYSTYVQFTDSQTGKPYSLAIALRGAHKPDSNRAAMQLDAQMATQVAILMERLLSGTL